MKIKKLMKTAVCVAAATLSVASVQALTSIQVQEIRQTILSVPVPEMPAKAAEVVVNANKKDRQAVAVTAVRAVVSKHRAAVPLVISAVSRVAPEVAPAIAVAASELATDQAAAFAHAAAMAAPVQAHEISAAVAKAVPAKADTVVAAVAPVVSTRGSASVVGGFYRIENQPINRQTGGSGNGTFNQNQPPNEAENPAILYNTPRQP
jgi:hypothetical protein